MGNGMLSVCGSRRVCVECLSRGSFCEGDDIIFKFVWRSGVLCVNVFLKVVPFVNLLGGDHMEFLHGLFYFEELSGRG